MRGTWKSNNTYPKDGVRRQGPHLWVPDLGRTLSSSQVRISLGWIAFTNTQQLPTTFVLSTQRCVPLNLGCPCKYLTLYLTWVGYSRTTPHRVPVGSDICSYSTRPRPACYLLFVLSPSICVAMDGAFRKRTYYCDHE